MRYSHLPHTMRIHPRRELAILALAVLFAVLLMLATPTLISR
jgi:hypothetical protein